MQPTAILGLKRNEMGWVIGASLVGTLWSSMQGGQGGSGQENDFERALDPLRIGGRQTRRGGRITICQTCVQGGPSVGLRLGFELRAQRRVRRG